jgi:hypothetical protein
VLGNLQRVFLNEKIGFLKNCTKNLGLKNLRLEKVRILSLEGKMNLQKTHQHFIKMMILNHFNRKIKPLITTKHMSKKIGLP